MVPDKEYELRDIDQEMVDDGSADDPNDEDHADMGRVVDHLYREARTTSNIDIAQK
jgi:hypothetical protein